MELRFFVQVSPEFLTEGCFVTQFRSTLTRKDLGGVRNVKEEK